jgi:hypothetical protein
MTDTPTTQLSSSVQELLTRLTENSRSELQLVRSLTEALRRADEQVVREVRNATLQHEIRREALLDELHMLGSRLCRLPAVRSDRATRAAIDHASHYPRPTYADHAVDVTPAYGPADTPQAHSGGHWRDAAQAIDDDLEFTFGTGENRH